MSAYADAATGVHGTDSQERPRGACAAPGCCLPGSMSTSTQGPSAWWCRVHFGAPASEHASITAHIANRRDLFRIACELINESPGVGTPSKARDQLRALGRPEFPQLGDITAHAMGAAILQVLSRECRTPQSDMGIPKPAGPSWLDAAQPEETEA